MQVRIEVVGSTKEAMVRFLDRMEGMLKMFYSDAQASEFGSKFYESYEQDSEKNPADDTRYFTINDDTLPDTLKESI